MLCLLTKVRGVGLKQLVKEIKIQQQTTGAAFICSKPHHPFSSFKHLKIMRSAILPTLLLSLFTFALSCDSCDKDEDITFPVFTGFSLTDENGQALSNADPTDWRTDDAWEQVEKDLFGSSQQSLCTGDGEVSPGYPNPCSNLLSFRFSPTEDATGYLRVVDKNFNLLMELDSVRYEAGSVSTVQLNFSLLSADTVRLYYRIVGDNCEYRGHGDVVVQ